MLKKHCLRGTRGLGSFVSPSLNLRKTQNLGQFATGNPGTKLPSSQKRNIIPESLKILFYGSGKKVAPGQGGLDRIVGKRRSHEMDEESLQELHILKARLAAAPHNIDLHVKYLQILNDKKLYDTSVIHFSENIEFLSVHDKAYDCYRDARKQLANHNPRAFRGYYIRRALLIIVITMYINNPTSFWSGKKDREKTENKQPNTDLDDSSEGNLEILNRSMVRKAEESDKKFTDVVGIDDYREELEELVMQLRESVKYREAGAKLPSGILLSGPPGTGKTLLAKAIASEADAKFFYSSGSDYDEQYVGLGAKRVRELFTQARQERAAVIFIDEIDVLGGQRNSAEPGWARQTLNQLLVEMDGIGSERHSNMIVIGATNFEQSLDKALMRPGRFDKVIHLQLPDVHGRQEILDYYIKKIQSFNVDTETIARGTTGFSGADLENLVNTAIINSVNHGRNNATMEDFDWAKDRILMGSERPNFMTEPDKKATAYHEMGHTLVALFTKGAQDLYKVTILPRGHALGVTQLLPTSQYEYTVENLFAQIDVAMGGRVAEELIYGERLTSTGCSSDLKNATNLAYQAVAALGMGKDSKLVMNPDMVSTQTKDLVDKEVKDILDASYQRVKTLLTINLQLLEDISMRLYELETMNRPEVDEFVTDFKKSHTR